MYIMHVASICICIFSHNLSNTHNTEGFGFEGLFQQKIVRYAVVYIVVGENTRIF